MTVRNGWDSYGVAIDRSGWTWNRFGGSIVILYGWWSGVGWDKFGIAKKGRGWFGTVLMVME